MRTLATLKRPSLKDKILKQASQQEPKRSNSVTGVVRKVISKVRKSK